MLNQCNSIHSRTFYHISRTIKRFMFNCTVIAVNFDKFWWVLDKVSHIEVNSSTRLNVQFHLVALFGIGTNHIELLHAVD